MGILVFLFSCQPMPWCSTLFRIVNLAFRVPLNSLDGEEEEEEENLQFLDLLPQVKMVPGARFCFANGPQVATQVIREVRLLFSSDC